MSTSRRKLTRTAVVIGDLPRENNLTTPGFRAGIIFLMHLC